MPCCGDREKGPVAVEEKWDYINLSDFRSSSCWTGFTYFFLYVFLLMSIAVYAVDSFTAVNLLAFSRWAGQIEPAIPFQVSRWIYAVCIIISFVLLILRWMKAIRAMRSGSIAKSYLDPLAVRIESIRMGKRGRGWRRFLVFAELTKSRKGAEYVALFAYFSFNSWLNILFADGPRQIVNAITLYSVMRLDLLPGGENAESENSSPVLQFFDNVRILAEHNDRQAVVLFGMLFTLVIWVLSVLKLALAIVLYLIFLFHHIPSEDGTLKAYCTRKINSRLKRIVREKVNKALAKGVPLQERKNTPAGFGGVDRKPTLPAFGDADVDKVPTVTTLSRSTTQTTLPPYSRPGTTVPDQKHEQPTLPDLAWSDEKPPLARTVTESSAYSESALLTGNAAVMGYSPLDRQPSPAPQVPPLPTNVAPPPAVRSYTPLSRPPTVQPRINPGPPPIDGPGRRTPARGYPGPTEGFNSYQAYPPSSTDQHGFDGQDPYRSFSPANDAYSRSLTHATAISPSDGGYPARSYTPAGHSGTPRPQMGIHASESRHPARSLTPANQSGTYRPAVGAGSIADEHPARSFTPVSHSATPRPQGNGDASNGYSGRSFTPVSQSATSRPQQPGGYVAFDPSMTSQTPVPRTQASESSTYRSYSRPVDASPSNEFSGPIRAYSPRNGTPKPQFPPY